MLSVIHLLIKRLRLIKYFDNYSIEIDNMRYKIHKDRKSSTHQINDVDELENVVRDKFELPNLPIRKAFEILTKKKNINLFEDSKKGY